MAETLRMRPLLGTYVEIGVDGPAAAADAGFAAVEGVQRTFSFHDSKSELTALNRGLTVTLAPPALCLLRLARLLMQRSGGRFDVTLGGALVQAGALPDHGSAAPLARGTADDLEIGAGWARWRRPLRVTLDGIAKGHAVDRAVAAMRRAGAKAGWVNAGGDLRSFGGLALPVQRREADGRLQPLGRVRDAALATSRVGERGAADPSFPAAFIDARPGVYSVLARRAWLADALTKVAATADGEALVARLGGCVVRPAGAGA